MDRMYNTTQLERELLYTLLNDRMTLRRVHPKIKLDWMSNDKRLMILENIKKVYSDHHSLITQDSLNFEIDKKFDESLEHNRIQDYKNEITIVFKNKPSEKIDFIIEKLEESQVADGVKSIIEDAFVSLEQGDIKEAVNLIKQGSINLVSNKQQSRIIALHNDSKEWREEIENRRLYPERYAGCATGLKIFDKLTGGLFPAELTIIFGLAGKGKSTIMKNIVSNIKDNSYNVLHIANEENLFQVQTKYHSLRSRIEYNKFKRGTITDEETTDWEIKNTKFDKEQGEIYVKEIPQNTDASLIESAVLELKQLGIEIDVICVDYMDLMTSIATPYSEWDEQGKVTRDLKQLAINCNLPVLTCTQAGTHTEKEESKDKPYLTAGDMYGTKQKSHTANTLIGLVNKTSTVSMHERKMSEQNLHKVVFCVCKNRDGPNFSFSQQVLPEIGLLLDDDDPDAETSSLVEKATAMADGVEAIEKTQNGIRKEYNENEDEISSLLNTVDIIMGEKNKK